MLARGRTSRLLLSKPGWKLPSAPRSACLLHPSAVCYSAEAAFLPADKNQDSPERDALYLNPCWSLRPPKNRGKVAMNEIWVRFFHYF